MNEAVCCYFPRITELSLGCWLSGHRKYRVSSSTVFFFVSYMHIHVPIIMYCSKLFVVFQEINCLHTFKHAYVCRVTELHLSTKFRVSPVSEIREWKLEEKKKKNSEIPI